MSWIITVNNKNKTMMLCVFPYTCNIFAGKSQFGEVYLAKARGIRPGELESQVVIKSLVSKEEQHYFEFNREMEMYSRMDHNNVIRVLGICREAEPLILITEHCDWVRNLLSVC